MSRFSSTLFLPKYLIIFTISILPLQFIIILSINLLLFSHSAYLHKAINFYFKIYFYWIQLHSLNIFYFFILAILSVYMNFMNPNFKMQYLLILSKLSQLLLNHPYQYSISTTSALPFHFSNLFSILAQSFIQHAQIFFITSNTK